MQNAGGVLDGVHVSSLTEAGMKQLATTSPEAHAAAIALYRHAIAMTFATGTAIVALALIALLFLPELPLATDHGQETKRPG